MDEIIEKSRKQPKVKRNKKKVNEKVMIKARLKQSSKSPRLENKNVSSTQ